MTTCTTRLLAAGMLAGLAQLAGAAPAPEILPPVQHAGNIDYLSGGIGQDETRAIEQAQHSWPLTLEFAIRDGRHAEFAANVAVKVHDAQGRQVLQTTSTGPFLLARLAPGRYSVDASFAGRTLHEQLIVKAGSPTRSVLVWPHQAEAAQS